MFLRQEVTAFQDQRAQLLHRQGMGVVGLRLQAQGPEQETHEQVHEPDDRIYQLEQRREDIGRGKRNALRITRPHHLGADFAEYENEKSDHQGTGCEREFAFAEQPERYYGDESGRCRVDQVVSQQDHAEQAIGAGKQLRSEACPTVAGLGQMPQPITVERHHAGFGNRKERGNDEQHDERNQQRRKRNFIQARAPLACRQVMSIGRGNLSVKQAWRRLRLPLQQYFENEFASDISENQREKACERPAHRHAPTPSV